MPTVDNFGQKPLNLQKLYFLWKHIVCVAGYIKKKKKKENGTKNAREANYFATAESRTTANTENSKSS